MKFKKKIKPYNLAAGGWDSIESTARFIFDSQASLKSIRNLLNINKNDGFDCPGCAWGNDNKSIFDFCENGAKAVAWESTNRTIDRNFFSKNNIDFLYKKDDYFLEYQGRLIEPLYHNGKNNYYEPISWNNAFKLIAKHINKMDHPNQIELYTSGRASNEAAWIYQLFGRLIGTNNFPDCSNMCHEASGIGLKHSIGVVKGTVHLEDFDYADAIFVFGQNPGTNHPRMLHSLRRALNRGAKIIVFNTLRERGLERFTNPKKPIEIITPMEKTVNSAYYQPNLGGDMAVVRGIVKYLFEQHLIHKSSGKNDIFDCKFIINKTHGIVEYFQEVANTSWDQIIKQSGLTKKQICEAASFYQTAKRVICTWGMGITQHKHSVNTVREIVNLQLLFGNIGKRGAGLCPVRGHSNVQGNRTMGINEQPDSVFLDKLKQYFKFEPSRLKGHNTIQALNAMINGHIRVFISLGGNLVAAAPDYVRTKKALSRCDLTVYISTKLNRSHLVTGHESLILPTIGRTEIDQTINGNQYITVEDTFGMVHASQGKSKPLSKKQRSEIAIITGIAYKTLGDKKIKWNDLATDYNLIRKQIADVIPGFKKLTKKCNTLKGFHLINSASKNIFDTESKKAQFSRSPLPNSMFANLKSDVEYFTLQTLRAHDQYNTTIYGLDDRYRGVYGQRNVLFINHNDINELEFKDGQYVDIETIWDDGIIRSIKNFKLVPYNIPSKNLAAYYPETNVLIPINSFGDYSYTPTYKSIPVRLKLSK
ncbi:CbbBc protein [Candidatus Pantoea edessiphila]|uniref:CbbBc protein n=1 Tax=Candidatus Pantoea edessiphila TaxID=2044610 RepID=A0A2P5SYP9_9GAMM|nr:FdhF/YdeP family oxidoreductase [Candidatus Pantoea edessiphila]MBK4775404.1 FdhF/YdeP family oxidoreductase [Pantoea sp. Edef]PPI87466.1 CbbBc protein [Candidatus Pantoea edessiphila]